MKNKKANCEKYERNVGRKGHGWRVGKLALILFGLVWGDSIGNTPFEREREREREIRWSLHNILHHKGKQHLVLSICRKSEGEEKYKLKGRRFLL